MARRRPVLRVGDTVGVISTRECGVVSLRWRDPGMRAYAYEVMVGGRPNVWVRADLELLAEGEGV